MKKKIKRLIHKFFSIPRYEKELNKLKTKIRELEYQRDYLQTNMYKYKNKVDDLLLEKRKQKGE